MNADADSGAEIANYADHADYREPQREYKKPGGNMKIINAWKQLKRATENAMTSGVPLPDLSKEIKAVDKAMCVERPYGQFTVKFSYPTVVQQQLDEIMKEVRGISIRDSEGKLCINPVELNQRVVNIIEIIGDMSEVAHKREYH